MGSINLKHTGSGSAIALSSDGTSLLLNGTAIGGGGGGSPDLFDENYLGGTKPSASGTNAVAIGRDATATNTNAVGIGGYAKATGDNAIAFGESAASGSRSLAMQIGQYQTSYGASGTQSLAIGVYNKATATEAIAIGRQSTASHNYSIALGKDISSTAVSQVSIGGSTQDVRISETYTLPKVDGTASGQVLTTNGSGTVSWATPSSGGGGGADLYSANESSPSAQPSATGTNAIAIGDSAISSANSSVAFPKSRANSDNSTAFSITNNGTSYGAGGARSIAIGKYAKTDSATWDNVAIGKNAISNVSGGVSIAGAGLPVKISNNYTLPTTDGTASGQVMTTNGSGVVSWAAAGGGSMNLISTTNFSSAVSSIDFTSLGSYTRWRIIGNFATASHSLNHTLKIFDNGTIVSSSSYTYIKDNKATNQTPVSTTSYGWSTNEGINKSSFIFDIEMVGGRPYIKMQGHGQSSGASSHMREFQTWGTLDDSYSLTSLTGLSLSGRDPFGGTVTINSGKVSLYGISS